MSPATPNRLARLREIQGLSRTDIGSRLGVSERTVYRWERGETPIPDDHKLELADLFGTSVVWLMQWEDRDGNGDGARQVRVA
jgi:transcriptional regulator with XRE-family HTH domain